MTDDLQTNIRARAKVWAGQITRLAHKNLGKFRSLITVRSTVQDQKGMVGIVSVADSRKGVARAYEYGSGIHSRLMKKSPKQITPKGEILIKPKTKKMLAFYWEVAERFPGPWVFAPDGRVLFNSVTHPGVKAANGGKGYLAPAVNEVRKQIRKDIPIETRKAVIGTFRKSFRK